MQVSASARATRARSDRSEREARQPHDVAAEHVDDEVDVDEARPRGYVGDVGSLRWFGRSAAKFRSTRSVGRGLAWSGNVVRVVFLPRTTPRRPILGINRSTVQRATGKSSRRSCNHTLRAL